MATPYALNKKTIAVLVPIKDFRHAKNRLSNRLDASERESLARTMARQVLEAAEGFSIHVVCDGEEVAVWAKSVGAEVIAVTQPGLNAAITEAMFEIADKFTHAIIVHADLPHAKSLDGIASPNAVSIVPDRHGRGTNVLSLPTGTPFKFHYGDGSLFSHMDEAISQGLDLKVLQIPELQWDVDTPEDLDGVADPSTSDL
mgnify:FL=1